MHVRFTLEIAMGSTNFDEDRDILYKLVRDKVLELRATLQLLAAQTSEHILPMPEITLSKDEFAQAGHVYDLDELQAEADAEEAANG